MRGPLLIRCGRRLQFVTGDGYEVSELGHCGASPDATIVVSMQDPTVSRRLPWPLWVLDRARSESERTGKLASRSDRPARSSWIWESRPMVGPLPRRQFLKAGVGLAAVGWAGSSSAGEAALVGKRETSPLQTARGNLPERPASRRTILSFYCDDTGPYTAGEPAFRQFLDYCAEQGIKGESSLILGARGRSMARHSSKDEEAYLNQVRRAWNCGLDTHMELMTHRGLFDFEGDREPETAVHEGLWLHEPEVNAERYERYIGKIIAEAERAGIRFTGLTWPGCGCDVCTKRYAELRSSGHSEPNPALWKALLALARKGAFRGPTVPCFFGSSETQYGAIRKANDDENAVFDLIPNALDYFGSYSNSADRVKPDYYISADGKSGIIVRHVREGAPYCLWYSHWQGLNPSRGVGWKAFRTVVDRIRHHVQDRVVWMRPSDITNRYQKAGGWSFLDNI